MNGKKLLSAALALAVAAALSVPVFAAEVAEGGSVSTAIEGTIAATQLVVTVPTDVAFQIDPTIDVTSTEAVNNGATTAQIIQPENLVITNGSVVPIYAKIGSVAVSKTGEVDDVTLLTGADGLTAAKSIMFGIGKTAPTDFATASDWLVKGDQAGNYLLSTDGKLAADDGTAGSGDDQMVLKLFGQTKKGWTVGDKFTVTPSIVVSAKPFPASAPEEPTT